MADDDRLTRFDAAYRGLGTSPHDGPLTVQDEFTYALIGALAYAVPDLIWDDAIKSATAHVTAGRARRAAQTVEAGALP